MAGGLLDGGLEEEGAVGGVQGAGVVEVDLELPAVELVVTGDDADAECLQLAERAQQMAVRVAASSGAVDVAGGGAVRGPAGGGGGEESQRKYSSSGPTIAARPGCPTVPSCPEV